MEYLCSLFWWNVFHNLLWHKMKYERNHSKDYFDRNFFGNLLWILLLYVHWFDLTRRFCPTFIKVSRIRTFKTSLEEHVCVQNIKQVIIRNCKNQTWVMRRIWAPMRWRQRWRRRLTRRLLVSLQTIRSNSLSLIKITKSLSANNQIKLSLW